MNLEQELPKPIFYLAGQMRGIEDENMPAFHEATKRLREMGFGIINPAETAGGEGITQGIPRRFYMQIDVNYIIACDGVIVLPSWRESPGAKLEAILAWNLDKPVLDSETLEPIEITGYDVHTEER